VCRLHSFCVVKEDGTVPTCNPLQVKGQILRDEDQVSPGFVYLR